MEIVIFWALCSILGSAILWRYDRAVSGFLLGLFFGPFGLLFALVIRSGKNKNVEQKWHEEQIQMLAGQRTEMNLPSKSQRECPYCAETILSKAKVCKHCKRDVEPIMQVDRAETEDALADDLGITHDGTKYYFREYSYDNLNDAVRQAKYQRVRDQRA